MSKPHIKLSNDGNHKLVTSDGLQNLFTSLNTESDPRTHNKYAYSKVINYSEIDALYRDGGIAGKIVDVPADDATREWREFNHDEASDIAKEEKRLGVQQYINKLIKYSRAYGGSAMLMVTGQDLSKPLDLDKVKKGDLKYIRTYDRWMVTPSRVNTTNPIEPDFLMPTHYIINQGSSEIHRSHFVVLPGIELPPRLMMLENYWGDSYLRRCLEEIYDFMASKGAIAGMLSKSNVDVINRKGLSNALSTEDEPKIIKRYSLMKMMTSSLNLMLLDGDNEEFTRHQINFGGMSDVMSEMRSWVSCVADIPITRLFGESSKGMNATGEGDLKNYYDSIRSYQESKLRGCLETLDEVMIRSALGYYPDDYEFEFKPLYQESGTERATQELSRAQQDELYINMGAIDTSHVMKRLQQEGTYAITDNDIAEREKLEKELDNEAKLNGGNSEQLPDFTEGFEEGDRGSQEQEKVDQAD